MDATWIITAFVLIDSLMERLNHRSDVRAQVPDSEVILIAVLSAKYFQNHHERAVCILRESGYLSGWIDVTRFNRRLHALRDWVYGILQVLGDLFAQGEVFIIDSMPMPVFTGIKATLLKLMRPPSLTRPVFAWFPCDATTCVPIPGLTISTYVATAGASKPFILSWRVWVCKGFMPVPIPALI